MRCEKVLDTVYEQETMSLLTHIRIGLHLLLCPNCAQEIERYEVCKDIFYSDFMPPSPDLEDSVMAMIAAEENELLDPAEAGVPVGLSTRSWVIAGIVMLVSLATAFFGMDFNRIAHTAGMSFMLPIGITIGIVLTCYGALFIGSHLKELTERFGL